jgi:4-amino-4-deoxy-L-arabinose transferase-like glycosyltransferase
MSASTDVPQLAPPVSPSSWSRDLGIIGAAAALAYLLIGWHPPISSAMRYAESAREMAHSSEWVVPTLNFVPYFEKPILTYWLGALSQSLFGSSPWAVQLPSFVCGLLSLFSTYAIGRHWRDARFGLHAALVLLFSGMFLVFTTVFLTDTVLSAFLALGWYAFWRHDRSPPCRWSEIAAPQLRWLWLFWIALAAAFLTKGPLAIILAGCAIGGYALLKGGILGVWRDLVRLRPLSGLVIMAAILLPWHLLAWHRDPRFLEYFYWHINVEAFFDGTINHPGPFWYYLVLVPVLLAPWSFIATPLLALALFRALVPVLARLRPTSAPATPSSAQPPALAVDPDPPADLYRLGQLYLTSIVVFPLLFLSISASKLGTYAMPLYPALALLVTDQLDRLAARPPRWLRFGLLVQVALMVVAGVLFLTVFAQPDHFKQVDWAWWPVLAGAIIALLAGGIWGGIAAARGAIRTGMAVVALGTALAIAVALPNAFHVLKYIDGRALAHTLAPHLAPADQVLLTTPCVHDHSLVWELNRPLGFLGHPRELGMGLFTSATPAGSPWPFERSDDGSVVSDPRTGAPKRRKLYELQRADVPAQTRLWTIEQLTRDWQGSGRIWLFSDGYFIDPLLKGHLPVYEIGRTDKITLVTNQPYDGLTREPMAVYQHGLP